MQLFAVLHLKCAGPNTGGKTATLKALGLAVLAAKSGLPVPAAAPARLPCFDAVLADIGESPRRAGPIPHAAICHA